MRRTVVSLRDASYDCRHCFQLGNGRPCRRRAADSTHTHEPNSVATRWPRDDRARTVIITSTRKRCVSLARGRVRDETAATRARSFRSSQRLENVVVLAVAFARRPTLPDFRRQTSRPYYVYSHDDVYGFFFCSSSPFLSYGGADNVWNLIER